MSGRGRFVHPKDGTQDESEAAAPPGPFDNLIPAPTETFDQVKAAAKAALLPYLDEVGLFSDLGGIVAQYCEPEPRWIPRFPNNVTYSNDGRTATSTDHLCDAVLMMADCRVSGRNLWELHVHAKRDEMWFGVTTNPELCASSWSMLSKDNCYSYYGGRESAIRRGSSGYAQYYSLTDGPDGAIHVGNRSHALESAGKLKSYSAGDTVSLLIDVPAHTMVLFHNGVYQATFSELPDQPLFLFAELDVQLDSFTLTVRPPECAPPIPHPKQ